MLHAAFFVLGMGLMAPLTAILQTMDYLNIFFAQYYPSRTLYTAYNTCNLIALVILFKWGDRVWPNKRSRMVTGYSLYTIILMCLPLVRAGAVSHFNAWAAADRLLSTQRMECRRMLSRLAARALCVPLLLTVAVLLCFCLPPDGLYHH